MDDRFNKREICEILQPRVAVLSEIPEMVDFFNALPAYENDLYINKKMKTTLEIALKALNLAKDLFASMDDWQMDHIHDALMNLAKEQGMKNGQLLFPLRVALTGKKFTPGGAIEISHILGKEESIQAVYKRQPFIW